MKKVKIFTAALVAVVAAFALLLSGAVSANASASARRHGTEHFVTGGVVGSHDEFVAHGLVTGGGRDVAPDNKPYDTLHFKNGSFRVRHPDKDAHFSYHVDPTTCFLSFHERGKYTITHGRGSLSGVKGHGRYRAFGAFIAKRKSNGKCDIQGEPQSGVFAVRGHGPISLPNS